jgi:hypothetical protein
MLAGFSSMVATIYPSIFYETRCRRERFYVPIIVGGASLFSHSPFLFRAEPIGLQYLAILMAVALVVVAADLIRSLYPDSIQLSA